MQGEAHWLPLVVVLLGGLALLAGLFLVAWSQRQVKHDRVTVPCPNKHKDAEIVLITDAKSGHVIGVDTCSLVEGLITCDRGCLAAAAQSRAPVRLSVEGKPPHGPEAHV
jgi:hypothetical protein